MMNKAIITMKDGRTFEHNDCIKCNIPGDIPSGVLMIVSRSEGVLFYNFDCVERVRYFEKEEG